MQHLSLLGMFGATPHIFFLPRSGETSLHQAAALRHRTICHYIVEAGASLMKTDLQVMVGGLGGILLWGWQELSHIGMSEEQLKGWSFCQRAACTCRRHQSCKEELLKVPREPLSPHVAAEGLNSPHPFTSLCVVLLN